MKYKDFLKDRWKTIALIIFGILEVETILLIYEINFKIRIFIGLSILISYFLGTFLEYNKKKKFYDDTIGKLDRLEDKYLISEMLNTPEGTEEKLLLEILQETDKSMNDRINKYKHIRRRIQRLYRIMDT